MISGKRGTKDLFISDSIKKHGNKYDYSEVVYVNNRTKVKITCPIHGVFYITPMSHLSGIGCKCCSKDAKKDLIFGFGVNDTYEKSRSKAFSKWYNMLRRCYDIKYLESKPTYNSAFVCDEWKYFSNFKKWFDANYIEGYHLDKDILYKGNKMYSPETCCFVPSEINAILTKSDSQRNELPIGVKKTRGKRYEARLSIYKGYVYLGTFDTPEEAFNAYKIGKEKWIKLTAENHFNNGSITEKTYNALLNYEVSITD